MSKPARVSFVRKGYTYVRLPEPNPRGGLCQLEIDPNVQEGEPCIRGTRIPAHTIAGYYTGTNMDYICQGWGITEAQVRACLDYINAPEQAAGGSR